MCLAETTALDLKTEVLVGFPTYVNGFYALTLFSLLFFFAMLEYNKAAISQYNFR